MDENTHEFFTELTEPGTYRVQVTTLSSSGDCEARESAADTAFTFYLSTSTTPSSQLTTEDQSNVLLHIFLLFKSLKTLKPDVQTDETWN